MLTYMNIVFYKFLYIHAGYINTYKYEHLSIFPSVAFNICCPRDCVSRHNRGTAGAPLKPLRDDSALITKVSLKKNLNASPTNSSIRVMENKLHRGPTRSPYLPLKGGQQWQQHKHAEGLPLGVGTHYPVHQRRGDAVTHLAGV